MPRRTRGPDLELSFDVEKMLRKVARQEKIAATRWKPGDGSGPEGAVTIVTDVLLEATEQMVPSIESAPTDLKKGTEAEATTEDRGEVATTGVEQVLGQAPEVSSVDATEVKEQPECSATIGMKVLLEAGGQAVPSIESTSTDMNKEKVAEATTEGRGEAATEVQLAPDQAAEVSSVAATEVEEQPQDEEDKKSPAAPTSWPNGDKEMALVNYARAVFKRDGRSAATTQCYVAALRKMTRGAHPISIPLQSFCQSFWQLIGDDFSRWRKTLSKEAARTCDSGNGVAALRILHKIGKETMEIAL